MKINKIKLIKAIYDKFGGELKYELIEDAVFVICSYIERKLIANTTFSVKNFGTLYSRIYKAHRGLDIATRKIRDTQSFRMIQMRPHINFSRLIKERKFKLRKLIDS